METPASEAQTTAQPLQPLNPSSPPSDQAKPIKKPTKLPIILMTIVTLLSLATAGYFGYQNYLLNQQIAQSPTASPSPATNPTIDWETYTSSDWDFQIKYPRTMKATKIDKRDDLLIGGVRFGLIYDDDAFRPQASEVNVWMYDSNDLSLIDWLKHNSTDKGFGSEPTREFSEYKEVGPATLGNIEGLKFTSKAMGFIDTRIAIKDSNSGNIYSVGYVKVADDLSSTFDHMLSTFKFLDKAENWKTEQWETEGSSQEAFIPDVTYNIEHPEDWIFSNNMTKDSGLDCFDLMMTDPENTVSIRISEVCTGWAASEDKTELPSNYQVIDKVQGTLEREPDYRYIIRSENTIGALTYIEGQSSVDNIVYANFTNAVLVTDKDSERNTHSYFNPVNISAIYEIGHSKKEEYLKILDRIVSSLIMTEISSQ